MTCSPASTPRPTRPLDIESLSWWRRLHAVDPVRRAAIAELHDRLRHEARFHIHLRATHLPDFPRSDVDDLAVQAADDALLVLLRKLDDYRGDSRFWTWARRFAELEAPVSIRRRLGHEHRATGDPEQALMGVADPRSAVHELAEMHEVLHATGHAIANELTTRQRTVLVASAINGVPTRKLADDLNTTPGAIYKTLHDARVKLRAQVAL
jgi:RNA polymerase sigma-70 factor (ECF subfamily)